MRIKKFISIMLLVTLVMSCGIERVFAQENDARAARITDFAGTVKILKGGGEKEFKAFKGMSLVEGDRIITGADSWVKLEIDGDKEIKLGDNTQISMSELKGSIKNQDDRTGISLFSGKIWTRIKKALNVKSKYEIKTPTTVMGVRGTVFFAGVDGDQTDVAVLEGTVAVTASIPVPQPDGSEEQQELEVVLQQNQQMTLDGTVQSPEDLQVEPVTPETLDLFVLQSIQEDPEGIDESLLQDIDQIIEQRQQEQQQQQQQEQQQQPQQTPQIVYDEDVVSDQDQQPDDVYYPPTPPVTVGTNGIISTHGEPYHAMGSIVTVQLEDSDLDTDPNTKQETEIQVTSDSDSAGITLILEETENNSGCFRGSVEIASYSDTAYIPPKIEAAIGDKIYFTYTDDFDGQGSSSVKSTEITVTGPQTEYLGALYYNGDFYFLGKITNAYSVRVDIFQNGTEFSSASFILDNDGSFFERIFIGMYSGLYDCEFEYEITPMSVYESPVGDVISGKIPVIPYTHIEYFDYDEELYISADVIAGEHRVDEIYLTLEDAGGNIIYPSADAFENPATPIEEEPGRFLIDSSKLPTECGSYDIVLYLELDDTGSYYGVVIGSLHITEYWVYVTNVQLAF